MAVRHLSVPSDTPPPGQRGGLNSQSLVIPPTPSLSTQGSAYNSQLHAQADALARMTFELNIRAVGAQADRLEQDLKELVMRTSQDKEFREKHEHRINEIWREILAVKTHVMEADKSQQQCKVDQETCRKQIAWLSAQLEIETTDLRTMVDGLATQLDNMQSSQIRNQIQTRVNAQPKPIARRLGVQTRAMAREKKLEGEEPVETADGRQSKTEAPNAMVDDLRKRIQETISSTRRWNRDHKVTTLDDGTFIANYLKQQSKRDPRMAVFIQKNIRKRIRTRLPRRATPPDTLEAFCRDLCWQDVTNTVEFVLVKNEQNTIRALQ